MCSSSMRAHASGVRCCSRNAWSLASSLVPSMRRDSTASNLIAGEGVAAGTGAGAGTATAPSLLVRLASSVWKRASFQRALSSGAGRLDSGARSACRCLSADARGRREDTPHIFTPAAIVVVVWQQQREFVPFSVDHHQEAVRREKVAPEEDVLVARHESWLGPELRTELGLRQEEGCPPMLTVTSSSMKSPSSCKSVAGAHCSASVATQRALRTVTSAPGSRNASASTSRPLSHCRKRTPTRSTGPISCFDASGCSSAWYADTVNGCRATRIIGGQADERAPALGRRAVRLHGLATLGARDAGPRAPAP